MAKCGNSTHIFRGTTKKHNEIIKDKHDEINSKLYRKYVQSDDPDPFTDGHYPIDEEKEMLERAKNFFYNPSYTTIQKLTTLQHFGGDTTLIDFSHDLYIALFFACNDDNDESDGQVIMVDTNKIHTIKNKDLYDSDDLSPAIIEAAPTDMSRIRASFQRSVFVHVPKGYIEEGMYITHPVEGRMKKSILDFLERFHQIKTSTVYNDTMGYIDYEKNYKNPDILFRQAAASSKKVETNK